MLPKVLKNFNLYIDGVGYAGLAEEITLPKLELATEEYRAAGMLGPVDIDLGLSGLSLEFTLGEYNDAVIKLWGTTDAGGINLRFLGGAVSEDGSGTSAIEVSARGRWKTLDPGTVKGKDLAKLKVTAPLTYYRYSVNGSPLVEIDLIAGKQSVNGTDMMASVLAALGLA